MITDSGCTAAEDGGQMFERREPCIWLGLRQKERADVEFTDAEEPLTQKPICFGSSVLYKASFLSECPCGKQNN